uniref:Triple QxxK/R motif-containing protein n=1 Tax=Anas platyrhynchos TaxID=8839 RepID=A0A8B9QZV2_ANAPL
MLTEQFRKQDYKKTRPMLRATRLKAEAKKTALGVKEVALVLAAILVFLLAFYAFFILTFPMKLTLIWIQMKTSRCNESIITISSA